MKKRTRKDDDDDINTGGMVTAVKKDQGASVTKSVIGVPGENRSVV